MLDENLLRISGDFFGGDLGMLASFCWCVLAVWTVDFCKKLTQRMKRKENMDFI